MNENNKIIAKCIKSSILWSTILIIIAIIITKITNNTFQDVLFFEGIFTTIIGVMGFIEGSSSRFQIHPLNDMTAQYMTNINLEILRKEQHTLKTESNPSVSTFVILIAGAVCLAISFLL